MLSAVAGFIAGSLHVLSGPDHLAALAPLVAGDRRRALGVGARWGLGHALGVTLIGVAAFLLRGVLPVEALSSVGERFVGVLLVGIGLWGFHRGLRSRVHAHRHTHDGVEHVHIHAHGVAAGPGEHPEHTAVRHRHTHAALYIGVLHGVAGGSHLVGVLPALALSRGAAVAYVVAFGVGTILTMGAFTLGVGLLSGRMARVGMSAHRALLYGCSAAALAVGVFWLIPR